MSGKVDICNQALIQLGGVPIESFNQSTTGSVLSNILYDPTRKSLLRTYKFSFATKRVELAQNASTPIYEYSYEYNLPSDLIRLLEVYDESDYRIENGKILTNSSSCKIKYIFDETDTTKWDTLFEQMMVSRLKVVFAYPITRSNTSVVAAKQEFSEISQRAMLIDSVEQYPDTYGIYDNTLIEVRS